MMLTNEDLQALSQLLDQKLKTELQPMKEDIHILKEDVSTLKENVNFLKEDVSFLKNKTTSLEIHLDNVTDRNIQSLAEGHHNLYIKLNNCINNPIPIHKNVKPSIPFRLHIFYTQSFP